MCLEAHWPCMWRQSIITTPIQYVLDKARHKKSTMTEERASNSIASTSAPSPGLGFPAVLHFLQSEWRKFERDRNDWLIERAEMKVCISGTLTWQGQDSDSGGWAPVNGALEGRSVQAHQDARVLPQGRTVRSLHCIADVQGKKRYIVHRLVCATRRPEAREHCRCRFFKR